MDLICLTLYFWNVTTRTSFEITLVVITVLVFELLVCKQVCTNIPFVFRPLKHPVLYEIGKNGRGEKDGKNVRCYDVLPL